MMNRQTLPHAWDDDRLLEQLDALNEDVPPMPASFHADWMKKVEDEAMKPQKKTPLRTMVTRALATAAAAIFVIGGAISAQENADLFDKHTSGGNGAAYSSRSATYEDSAAYGVNTASYEEDYAMTGDTVMMMKAAPQAAMGTEAAVEKKIIRTASRTIGTQSYQSSLESLRAQCEDLGGWVESFSESTSGTLRVAYLTLRIPSERLDAFLEGSQQLGRIIRRTESAQDVTNEYQDTATRLSTQLALMDRLQALVTDAADLSDLLALESQIADTQYTIDRLQSSLNATDRQVDYATVDVTLREESPATDIVDTEKTFWERLTAALSSGVEAFLIFLENMFVFAAAALPFIGVVAALWIIVRLLSGLVKKWKHRA